jgi:hypothetical protein
MEDIDRRPRQWFRLHRQRRDRGGRSRGRAPLPALPRHLCCCWRKRERAPCPGPGL